MELTFVQYFVIFHHPILIFTATLQSRCYPNFIDVETEAELDLGPKQASHFMSGATVLILRSISSGACQS